MVHRKFTESISHNLLLRKQIIKTIDDNYIIYNKMVMDIPNLVGIILLGIGIFYILFIFLPWAFGAPFEPSSRREIKNMVKLAKIRKGEKVAELGSGNGKVVIELARKGAQVHGYEINPFLVLYSKRKIKKLGLQKNAVIHWQNFWKIDLREFDVIVLFQIHYIMKKLGRKIKKEAKKGTRIVSNTWRFPGMKPLRKISKVYLYRI